MINSKIRQLDDDILDILNHSDVPIEAKRYILLNVLRLTEKEADLTIMQELRQNMETIKEEGEINDAESTRCEQE